MSEREIVFWAAEDTEELRFDDLDEAIEHELDDMDELPKTLTMCGYARMQINAEAYADFVLDYVIERLDETYGDPSEMTVPTDAMKEAAAQAFGLPYPYDRYSMHEAPTEDNSDA